MSKAHRGSGVRTEVKSGRGVCPICKRSNIKVLYDATIDDQKVKICKTCNATRKNSK